MAGTVTRICTVNLLCDPPLKVPISNRFCNCLIIDSWGVSGEPCLLGLALAMGKTRINKQSSFF